MPAMTTCPTCGFDGPHGFTVPFPYTTKFYHGSCVWYVGVGGQVFTSLEDAAKAVVAHDSRYDRLWLAYILNSRSKLGRLHSKRCDGNGRGLQPKDLDYIRTKGITLTW